MTIQTVLILSGAMTVILYYLTKGLLIATTQPLS